MFRGMYRGTHCKLTTVEWYPQAVRSSHIDFRRGRIYFQICLLVVMMKHKVKEGEPPTLKTGLTGGGTAKL